MAAAVYSFSDAIVLSSDVRVDASEETAHLCYWAQRDQNDVYAPHEDGELLAGAQVESLSHGPRNHNLVLARQGHCGHAHVSS